MENLNQVAIATILKGLSVTLQQMSHPSLIEVNRILVNFGMELIIKAQFYKYRRFPCMNFTWYVSGDDVRSDGTSSGILEWCINENDAYKVLADMKQFSHFADLKVGNTEWEMDTIELTEIESTNLLTELGYEKSTLQFGEFVLSFDEAIQYLKECKNGKITYESAKNGSYVHNSDINGFYSWSDFDGLGNAKWFTDLTDRSEKDRFYQLEKWAIVG